VTRKGSAADPLAELLAAIPVVAGRAPTEDDRRRFARYLDLLLEWNRVHDLTGLAQPREIVRALFLDSLLFLPLLPPRPIRLVDIGSGAGIPGLPLRIVDPGIEVTLIEARRKRVSFLSTVRREVGLDGVEVLEGRVEDMATQRPDLEQIFDAATVRAIRLTADLVSASLRLLRPGGHLIASGRPAGSGHPSPFPFSERVSVPSSISGQRREFLIITRPPTQET
jgi:16S rRNA (guanine527-N7)-methyltransferase